MYCCLKARSRSKKPVNQVPKGSEDHTKSYENETRLSLRTAVLSESRARNPHEAIPAVAELDASSHQSAVSNEPKAVNQHEATQAIAEQGSLLLQPTASSGPIVSKADEMVPTEARMGRNLRTEAFPAIVNQGPLPLQTAVSSEPVEAKRNRNLWNEAFTQLNDDKKHFLSQVIVEPQGPSVVEKIAEQTEQRFREHEQRGWKISWGKSSSNIDLRAALKKVFVPVLKFSKLIRAGIAFDPTGYATVAWAIISLGLQMVQNDMAMLESVSEACGTLAEALTRYAVVEASYRDRTVPDSDHLEDIIVENYVAILDFSAEVARENGLNNRQRILRSITALTEQPFQEFTKALSHREEKLSQWTDIIEHQYRKQEMKEIDDKVESTLVEIEQLAQQLSNVASKMLTAEEERMLTWLSEYPYSASHLSATSQREPDTGEWVLKSSEYDAWTKSGGRILWLYGNSGCGKSFLCSKIVDHLEDLCNPKSSCPDYFLAYWYFTFSNGDSLNIDNLLCSTIRQICAGTRTVPQVVRELWEKHSRAGSRPSRTKLMETLDSVIVALRSDDRHALVVVDALDEYPLAAEQASSGTQSTSGRRHVLQWLQNLCRKHANAHVLITSRDETDIRTCLEEAEKLDVARRIVGDLDLFIQRCIDRVLQDQEDGWKAGFKSEMSARIEGINEKRFRWATLMKQKFFDCIDREMMEEALKSLPESLEEMYADVLRRIPKGYSNKVRLILIWLAYSMRPLTLQELACAASLPDPRKVLEICTSSLVTVSRKVPFRTGLDFGEKDIVKFDHFSVKEYLTSGHLLASGSETAYFYATPLAAHLEIAQISVSYLLKTNKYDLVTNKRINPTPAEDLNFDSSEEPSSLPPPTMHPKEFWLPVFPLLDYSVGWYHHVWEADVIEESTYRRPDQQISEVQRAEGCADQELLRRQIHSLFCSKFFQSFKNWLLLLPEWECRYIHHPSRECPIYGVPHYSPIVAVSWLNLPDHVQRLIGSGISVDGDADLESESAQLRTKPIYAAAKAGRLQVLKLLLEHSASLEQWEMDTIAQENERHGVAVLSTIVEARPHLAIENSTVVQSAMNDSKDILRYSLDVPGPVTLTENLLVSILKNFSFRSPFEDDLVEIILSRADGIGCDNHRILKFFFRESNCRQAIRVVIDRYKPPPSMVQQLVKWAIGNIRSGYRVLAAVLKYYNDVDVEFSPEMLAEAASSNLDAIEMFWTILRNNKNCIAINDRVMAGIADNYRAIYIMSLLMDHEGCREKDPLDPSAIIGRYVDDAVISHLDTCVTGLSLQMIEAAARWEPDAIEYLQAHARPNITFIRNIAETAPSSSSPRHRPALAITPSKTLETKTPTRS